LHAALIAAEARYIRTRDLWELHCGTETNPAMWGIYQHELDLEHRRDRARWQAAQAEYDATLFSP
jgi:hypothetical protein